MLALQGDFEAHRRAIERAGQRAGDRAEVDVVEVRTAEEMAACDGLIVPGGESTTMLKLLQEENLLEPLRAFGREKPIFGTCAGAILLASEVSHPAQPGLGLMDIAVDRNAYGRQIDSSIAKVPLEGGGEVEAVFIRAPVIRRVGREANVLARYRGDPVWVEQGRHMVTTFHPELTQDPAIHRHFLEKL